MDVADIETEIMESEEYMIDLESRTCTVRRLFTHQDGAHRDATQWNLQLVCRVFMRNTTTHGHTTLCDRK